MSFFDSRSDFICFCKLVSTFTCFRDWCVTFYLLNVTIFVLVNKGRFRFLDWCVSNDNFIVIIRCSCSLCRNFFYTCNVTFFLRDCYFWQICISVTYPVNVNRLIIRVNCSFTIRIQFDSTCVTYCLFSWFKYLLSCKIFNIVCIHILNCTIDFFSLSFLNV